MTYVIVGNGPAGVSAVEQIRQLDASGRIIVVAQENNPPYSRIMTPEYMTGEVEEQDLFYRGTDFYQKFNVETRLGHRVDKVLTNERQVVLDNGEVIAYSRLLLATGSKPNLPPWVRDDVEGIFKLWDKADSEAIGAFLPGVEEAAIVGGGLVGLQAARALVEYGVRVTVIEMADRLMPVQLDPTAADLLLKAAQAHGVNVLLGTKVEAVITAGNRVFGLDTSVGRVNADMVLVATGVRPNLAMVEDIPLNVDKGLMVNHQMETNIAGIYAAGDIAQAPCGLTGEPMLRALWFSAVQQGKVAGSNMAGGFALYQGSQAMNSILLFGLSIVSLGTITSAPGLREVVTRHPKSGNYHKVMLKDGVLVGLLFVGDVQKAGELFYKLGKPLTKADWRVLPDEEGIAI